MKKYPDRFMLSTDSAYGITYIKAIGAMYEVLDQIDEWKLRDQHKRS